MNDESDAGSKLVQKFVTIFASTFDIVESFLKSEPHVRCLVDGKDGEATEKVRRCLGRLKQQLNTNNSISQPALDAIVAIFSPI